MAIPQWYEFMRPVLVALDTHGTQSVSELEECIVDAFGLTDDERAERLEKSGQRRLLNRLGWATTSFEKAGYLAYGQKKGTYRATGEGRAFLNAHPAPFTDKDLLTESKAYKAWKSQKKLKGTTQSSAISVAAGGTNPAGGYGGGFP